MARALRRVPARNLFHSLARGWLTEQETWPRSGALGVASWPAEQAVVAAAAAKRVHAAIAADHVVAAVAVDFVGSALADDRIGKPASIPLQSPCNCVLFRHIFRLTVQKDQRPMATTKTKGDLAELMVAADLRRKGYKIALPFGEDWDYDLIFERDGKLERVQVKYAESDGSILTVRCRSHSLTNGKVKRVKRYTAAMIDWLAVYDRSTNRCYYVPAQKLGATGRSAMYLRMTPTRNGQRLGINFAEDYLELGDPIQQPLG
jgi:hypothetical protein